MGNQQVKGCITFCLKLQEAATDDDKPDNQVHDQDQIDQSKDIKSEEQRIQFEELKLKFRAASEARHQQDYAADAVKYHKQGAEDRVIA